MKQFTRAGWCAVILLMVTQAMVTAQDWAICEASEMEITVMGEWSSAAPMSMPRSEQGIAALDGKIYIAGGFAPVPGTVTDAVEVYDPVTDTWESRAPMPMALHHMGMTAHDGKIYATGGYRTLSFTLTDRAFVYDPEADTWTEIASLPEPHGAHQLVSVGDRLYLFGGFNDGRTLWSYDPVTDTWDTSPRDMFTPREHLASVVWDDKVYAIGGRWNGNTNVLEVYDPETDRWDIQPDMPTARGGYSAAVIDGLIYAAGGEDFVNDFCAFDRVEVYDPATEIWMRAPDFPVPVHAQASIALDGRWYVLGGATEAAQRTYTSMLADVWVFTPAAE